MSERDPIAIIGIGCRFPGGITDPESFWRVLREGIDAISEIPLDRFDAAALYSEGPLAPGRIGTRRGGFLEGIDRFDASFFGIAPREAERMDPQQRLLLETSWEALEDAGQPVDALLGSRTGVFVGLWSGDFEVRAAADPTAIDLYMAMGGGRYAASGRISYILGLQGPSISIDTACSSSLVAVHLACQSLHAGESDLALAGGVNVILHPYITIAYSQSGMLAPDGRCKFGDARGDGYVRSEGAGMVLLKPLSRALADGDRIYAVIRGSAVNNDGRSGDSLVKPAQAGQEEMLRRAYQDAGISPGEVHYIEAHGTGTRAGDPTELAALGTVLAEDRPPDRPCPVGSVKPHFGHTEAAAGVAGVIKAALVLRHREIPATLHLEELSPRIRWHELPLFIPRQPIPLPLDASPALAGVNSFGISGTNAHVVLAEAPVATYAAKPDGRAVLVPLSARAPAALRALAAGWLERFSAEDAPALSDLAYTASCRRTHHEHRLAIVAHDRAELLERLRAFAAGQPSPATSTGQKRESPPPVVFVFPGQGSQWVGMGRGLLEEEPVFRAAFEECERAMRPFVDWSLLEQIGLEPGAAGYLLDRIDVIQPTLVALEIALARLWRSWGVEPNAVVGHSMGEVAAAQVAGALSLGDAMRVICRRSQLMRRTSGQGAMAVVELPRAAVQAAIAGYEERVAIAASNSPRSTILSGEPAALEEILDSLTQQNVFCRRVNVDVASHSPQMDPLRDELLAALKGLAPRHAAVPFYSTVQAEEIDGVELDPAYWARNLRQPVLFSETVQRLLEEGHEVFLEVSPHPVLVTALEQVIEAGSRGGAAFASLRRHEPERGRILQTLGELYVAGFPVDWTRLYAERGELVRLPSYPWQRQRHWIERGMGGRSGWGAPATLPGRLLRSPAIAGWVFESRLSAEAASTFGEHRIAGAAVVPAALFVEGLTAAVWEALGREALAIEDLTFHRPLVLAEDGYRIVQMILHPAQAGRVQVEVHSRREEVESGEWVLHVTGGVVLEERSEGAAGHRAAAPSLEEIRTRCPQELLDWSVPRAEAPHAAAGGFPIDRIFRGADEAFALLRRSGTAPDGSASAALLDACFRAMTALDGEAGTSRAADGRHLVLTSVRRIRFRQAASPELVCHLLAEPLGEGAPTAFIAGARILEPAGALVAQVEGARFAWVRREALLGTRATSPDDWQYEIVWRPRGVTGAAAGEAPALGSWLVFADRTGVGAALAAAVLGRGGECQLVYPPEGEEQVGADLLARMERALDAWAPAADLPAAVAYLWSLEPPAVESAAAIQARASSACAAAMVLARRLDERTPAARTRLWIVTRAAQPVRAGDAIAPVQAPVWSLARGIALECPEIWGGLIDLNPQADVERDAHQLLLQIGAEEHEDQVAFRDDTRYAPRLVRAEKLAPAAPALHSDGAYLITGAMGSLGLKLGRWLVDRGAGHLVLLGRRSLPDRAEWSTLPPLSPFSSAVKAIQDIERMGARVTTAAVDVTDVPAMGRLIARFGADLPPLRGVFHAAAVMEFASLHRLQPDRLDAMLRPKVEGSWVLHQLTRDRDLDHFVLFSSASALWGSRGMAHYAAANHFLDALAHYRRWNGLPALSINWGGWEGGASSAETTRFLELSDFRLLPPAGALEVLGQLMVAGAVQRTVAEVDWAALRAAYEFRPGRPLLEEIEVAAAEPLDDALLRPAAGILREIEALPEDEALAFLTSHVRGEVAAVLGLEREQLMEPGKGFFKLGMDSLMTVELRTRLERSTGLRLPTTIAFEYPTIEALGRYLAGDLLRRIEPAEEASLAAVPALEIEPTSLEAATEAELAAMLDGALADLLNDED